MQDKMSRLIPSIPLWIPNFFRHCHEIKKPKFLLGLFLLFYYFFSYRLHRETKQEQYRHL